MDKNICALCFQEENQSLTQKYGPYTALIHDMSLCKIISNLMNGIDLSIIKNPMICITCNLCLKEFWNFYQRCILAHNILQNSVAKSSERYSQTAAIQKKDDISFILSKNCQEIGNINSIQKLSKKISEENKQMEETLILRKAFNRNKDEDSGNKILNLAEYIAPIQADDTIDLDDENSVDRCIKKINRDIQKVLPPTKDLQETISKNTDSSVSKPKTFQEIIQQKNQMHLKVLKNIEEGNKRRSRENAVETIVSENPRLSNSSVDVEEDKSLKTNGKKNEMETIQTQLTRCIEKLRSKQNTENADESGRSNLTAQTAERKMRNSESPKVKRAIEVINKNLRDIRKPFARKLIENFENPTLVENTEIDDKIEQCKTFNITSKKVKQIMDLSPKVMVRKLNIGQDTVILRENGVPVIPQRTPEKEERNELIENKRKKFKGFDKVSPRKTVIQSTKGNTSKESQNQVPMTVEKINKDVNATNKKEKLFVNSEILNYVKVRRVEDDIPQSKKDPTKKIHWKTKRKLEMLNKRNEFIELKKRKKAEKELAKLAKQNKDSKVLQNNSAETSSGVSQKKVSPKNNTENSLANKDSQVSQKNNAEIISAVSQETVNFQVPIKKKRGRPKRVEGAPKQQYRKKNFNKKKSEKTMLPYIDDYCDTIEVFSGGEDDMAVGRESLNPFVADQSQFSTRRNSIPPPYPYDYNRSNLPQNPYDYNRSNLPRNPYDYNLSSNPYPYNYNPPNSIRNNNSRTAPEGYYNNALALPNVCTEEDIMDLQSSLTNITSNNEDNFSDIKILNSYSMGPDDHLFDVSTQPKGYLPQDEPIVKKEADVLEIIDLVGAPGEDIVDRPDYICTQPMAKAPLDAVPQLPQLQWYPPSNMYND